MTRLKWRSRTKTWRSGLQSSRSVQQLDALSLIAYSEGQLAGEKVLHDALSFIESYFKTLIHFKEYLSAGTLNLIRPSIRLSQKL